MKRFISTFILALCFSTICIAGCPEQIKAFYKTYLTNIVNKNSQNKTLCKRYITEELLAKLQRLGYATGGDPIIRAQDANKDVIETLCVKNRGNDWYTISYLWNKTDSSTITVIPLKAKNINGNCKITYITPVYNGSEYGDELLTHARKAMDKIEHSSALVFVKSFYKAYAKAYCKMPKDITSVTSPLRINNLSKKALKQFNQADSEKTLDGVKGYDLLINNFDFDSMWFNSIRCKQVNNSSYQVTYSAGNISYKIIVSIKKKKDRYIIDSINS